MINEPDLSILLTAQPRFLEDELSGQAPALPSFQESHQQVNDPRRPLPILVKTDSGGSNKSSIFTAKTISFLAPSNGAFGEALVYIKGNFEELT